MKLLNILFVITFCIMGTATFGQTYAEPSDTQKILNNEMLTPLRLMGTGISTENNPRNMDISGNSIFLDQIGDFNETFLNTSTVSSEIKVIQNGNFNEIYLDYYTRTAVADLLQEGNFNIIRDIVSDPGKDISLDLIQDGDYLHFEREGVNELTKSLQFHQTEASPLLIIRSFP